MSKYNVGLKTIVLQGLSEPKIYGDSDTEVLLLDLHLSISGGFLRLNFLINGM